MDLRLCHPVSPLSWQQWKQPSSLTGPGRQVTRPSLERLLPLVGMGVRPGKPLLPWRSPQPSACGVSPPLVRLSWLLSPLPCPRRPWAWCPVTRCVLLSFSSGISQACGLGVTPHRSAPSPLLEPRVSHLPTPRCDTFLGMWCRTQSPPTVLEASKGGRSGCGPLPLLTSGAPSLLGWFLLPSCGLPPPFCLLDTALNTRPLHPGDQVERSVIACLRPCLNGDTLTGPKVSLGGPLFRVLTTLLRRPQSAQGHAGLQKDRGRSGHRCGCQSLMLGAPK